MSRWTKAFENHPFQEKWKSIVENTKTAYIEDKTIETDVQELARFKKAVTFLDSLLKACDPELTPESVWRNFDSEANNCLNQLNSFNSNDNIDHIKNANSHIDNLLSYLRPYVVNSKGSAQAAGRAFKAYSETIQKSLKEFKEETSSTIQEINTNKVNSDGYLEEIEDSKKRIKNFEKEFLDGDEETESIQSKILSMKDSVKEWYDKINVFHNELTTGDEEKDSLIKQIKTARDNTSEYSKTAKENLENSQKLINDLDVFYTRIFGKENNRGNRDGGLKKQLDQNLLNLNDITEKHKTKYVTIENEIKSLIGPATTAGLATAYKNLKESFDKPIENYTKLFYWSLFGLVSLAILSFSADIFYFKIDLKNTAQLFNNLIFKLPFLLPLVWLTVFASRRRSENSRLQQEYAHKEAIATSYQSFKEQIKDLNQTDNDMMMKLMETAILAIAFNASETLDGKHGDKMPLENVLDKLTDKFSDKFDNLDLNIKTKDK